MRCEKCGDSFNCAEHSVTIIRGDEVVTTRIAKAAAGLFRDTGIDATGVILGWEVYLRLVYASRGSFMYQPFMEDQIMGLKITVDPESRDRVTPLLDPLRTATYLAFKGNRPIPVLDAK